MKKEIRTWQLGIIGTIIAGVLSVVIVFYIIPNNLEPKFVFEKVKKYNSKGLL